MRSRATATVLRIAFAPQQGLMGSTAHVHVRVDAVCTPSLRSCRLRSLSAFACHSSPSRRCKSAPPQQLTTMGSLLSKPVAAEPAHRACKVKAAAVQAGSTSNTFVVSWLYSKSVVHVDLPRPQPMCQPVITTISCLISRTPDWRPMFMG